MEENTGSTGKPQEVVTAEELMAKFPKMSEEAARILSQPGNSSYCPTRPGVWVEVIEFAEPGFLAGPIAEKYGLVFIEHFPDAKPLEEQLQAMRKSVIESGSTTYMPWSAKARLKEVYSDGTLFYWDPVNKESYAELDLPHLSAEHRERLTTKGERCQLFANTDAGKAELASHLTEPEKDVWLIAKQKAANECAVEMVNTVACAERPYRFRLEGNDDSSWTTNLATQLAVFNLLEELRIEGYDAVSKRMTFTN